MNKVILTVTKCNVHIKWEHLSNMIYGTKLNNTHLNAKAFGPRGQVTGLFEYFDQDNRKININDILNVGHHKISAIFSPTDLNNYESKTIIRYITVLPNRNTCNVHKNITVKYKNLNNSSVININVNTNF